MSGDVIYRGPEGAPSEGDAPLARPDVPISESQREPRIPFGERINRKLEREGRGPPVSHKDEKAVRGLTGDLRKPKAPIEPDLSPRSDGSTDLRTASRASSAEHAKAHSKNVLDYMGVDHDQLSDQAKQRIGEDLNEAGRKPGEGKKTKIGLMVQDPVTGELRHLPPVRDHKSIKTTMLEGNEPALSLQGATERQANWREFQQGWEEAAQRSLLAEVQGQLQLGATPEQIADPDFVGLERPVQPSQPVEPQRAQPQRQTPDPLAQERQLLARQHAEAKRIAETAKWSAAESDAARTYHTANTWLAQQPENNAANLANLKNRAAYGDAAAVQRLQVLQDAVTVRNQAQARFQELNRGATDRRIALQNDQAARDRADYKRWAAQNDQRYQEILPTAVPQYANAEGRKQLSAQALKTLKAAGLDDQGIEAHWAKGAPIYMRDASSQALIAKASAWDLLQAQITEAKLNGRWQHNQQLPPVMAPGGVTVGPRGGGDVDDIKRLQGKVSGARSERAALQAATSLMQARRRSG